MNGLKNKLYIFLFSVFFLFCLIPESRAESIFWQVNDPQLALKTIMNSLSIEQLAGQVLLLAYPKKRPQETILSQIREWNLGGIKIFGWNGSSLSGLAEDVAKMQKAASKSSTGIPLIIATDQEGGSVRHIRFASSQSAGSLALGATDNLNEAYWSAFYIGKELAVLGINMNFAPTVDIYSHPEAFAIGSRSFGQDPHKVSRLAYAYFRGMHDAGIMATAKHFPGHGNASRDSHGTLPIVLTNKETLYKRELLPYRLLIEQEIPAIMSGHLAFPKINQKIEPASLSAYFLEDVLRKDLGFKGILVTDDMRMAGASGSGLSTMDACLKALDAGNDMVLVSLAGNFPGILRNRIIKKMQRDKKFYQRIYNSAERIIWQKLIYLRQDNSPALYPDPAYVRRYFPNQKHQDYFDKQAFRSVTFFSRKEKPAIKIKKSDKVLLAGQFDEFFDYGKQTFPHSDNFYFPYQPHFYARSSDKREMARLMNRYDYIIFCLANPSSYQVLEVLEKSKAKIIVLSVQTPIYLREYQNLEAAFICYGYYQSSFKAGFSALKGEIPALGNLPLKLEGKYTDIE